jgi:hypothetical protein
MAVLSTKAVLCCEFEVRVDVDGTETETEILDLAQDVFSEYRDVLIGKLMDGDKRAVGELFPLTIANKDQLQFFIPRTSLRRLCRQINNNGKEECCDKRISEVEYAPRNTLG